MKSNLITKGIIALMAFFLMVMTLGATDYLYSDGNKIVDDQGYEVWLTGINWFGFETSNNTFHGIWTRDMKEVLDQIADLGFNILRIPLHARLVQSWMQGAPLEPVSINYYQMNEYLEGKNSFEVLNIAIDYCEQIGLKVMLDMHSISAGTYMDNLWYEADFTTQNLIEVWEFLADYYKGNDTVIAMDLKNEPHGAYSQGDTRAIWDDSTQSNNWKKAAEDIAKAVLAKNPDVLILIEGIQCYPKEGKTWNDSGEDDYYGTWWGGNLRGVKDHPIDLGVYSNKLVYSPHEYGPGVYPQPWFEGNFTKESLLNNLWRDNWFYLHEQNISPLLIGEWGGYIDGGDNEKWMRILKDFLIENKIHHTFWCLNPNSGDTGGILLHDWTTVTQDGKYEIVEECLWQDAAGTFIGLDKEIPLGKNGQTYIEYYGAPQCDPCPFNLKGYVTDQDGTPLSNVNIYAGSSTTVSDQQGYYEISAGLECGQESVQIVAAYTSPFVTEFTEPVQCVAGWQERDIIINTTQNCVPGDVDGDGKVTIIDALLLARCSVNLIACECNECTDVNGDGVCDILDALLMARVAAGLETL